MSTKKKPAPTAKRGRPLDTSTQRDIVLGVRLTPSERLAVDVAAAKEDRKASAWARSAILKALGVKTLLVLALALAACDGTDMGSLQTYCPVNVEIDTPPMTYELEEVAAREWATRLGADLDIASLPTVRWFEGDCLTYPDDGPLHCREGAFSAVDGEIHLLIRRDALSFSSLAHETLHWALLQTTGDSDHGHDGAAWAEVMSVQHTMLEVER